MRVTTVQSETSPQNQFVAAKSRVRRGKKCNYEVKRPRRGGHGERVAEPIHVYLFSRTTLSIQLATYSTLWVVKPAIEIRELAVR